MNFSIRVIACCLLLIGTSFILSFAQELKPAGNVILPANFPIKIELAPEPPDKKGTDVTNIKRIHVDYADPNMANNAKFTILFYVDGLRVEELKNQPLPLDMKRNFKGWRSGSHEIKIVIEGGNETILASQTVKVNVVH